MASICKYSIFTKKDHGIFYAEDYVKHYASGEESTGIIGLTHPEYWDISTHSCLFRAAEGHSANQVLSAFFEGPTFAECASVIQACVYRAIEEMIGTNEFNRLFGTSLTRFLITPILFDKIYSESEKPEYSLDFRSAAGNPLLFLFDKAENIAEDNINLGDILYIKGVDKYPDKHLVGSGSGWNVICVGKNSDGENLYLGFGPETFPKPLTYKEIKSVLIKYYNSDQLLDTKKLIERIKGSSEIEKDELLMKSRAFLSEALVEDKLSEDYPIVGLQYVIRLNKEKLENFLKNRSNAWHSISLEELEQKYKLREPTLNNSVKQITAITIETRGKSFADYEAKTPTQIEMLSVAKKFTLAVCGERSASVGLVMTDMPGIGKTHLSIAVADYVAKRGMKVVYVDAPLLDFQINLISINIKFVN